jgi:hypothetical protein
VKVVKVLVVVEMKTTAFPPLVVIPYFRYFKIVGYPPTASVV